MLAQVEIGSWLQSAPAAGCLLVSIVLFLREGRDQRKERSDMRKSFIEALKEQSALYLSAQENQRQEYLQALKDHRSDFAVILDDMKTALGRVAEAVQKCSFRAEAQGRVEVPGHAPGNLDVR